MENRTLNMRARRGLLGLLAFGGALVAWTPSLLAAQAFQESAGQVVMEAEHFDATTPRSGEAWTLGTSPSGFSGTGHLTATPNTGTTINSGYTTTSPELVFNVQFATTGTYYVWVRGQAMVADGSNDSLHAGLDGLGPASADRMDGFNTTSWVWKRQTLDGVPPTLVISTPGLHTIHLWMREDGLRVDKILLRTSSSSTAPSGTGPAESPRVTVGPPPDITPPGGSVTINGGAAGTNSLNVTLTLVASDNSGTVSQMQFSNNGTSYSSPEPYGTSKTWALLTGDGTKTVSAKFADPAGNWSSAVSDSIVLDTVPPQLTITSPVDGAVIVAPTP